MNPSMSRLNPRAASYIPLSKREEEEEEEEEDKQRTDVLLHYGPEGTTDFSMDCGEACHGAGYDLESDLEELLDQAEAEGSKMDMDFLDREDHAEKYLEFLEIWFPSISKQCLADVFSANHGDLEASVNMLKELKSSPDAASKPLPAVSLDTGDASEFGVVSGRKETRDRVRRSWLHSTDCVRCYVVR